MNLSVIVPTLNEEKLLPKLLRQLKSQLGVKLEIIVSDGGSTDKTVEIALKEGAKVITGEAGRSKQLNAGARFASYDMLLFIHADSQLHNDNLLKKALGKFKGRDNEKIAGHFPLRFDYSQEKYSRNFRYLEAKTKTNRRYTINGDQGMLIGKKYFWGLGGYDETLSVMEDQKIADQIFIGGQWLLLPGHLQTSGRRFEIEGFHRRYVLMSIMMGLFWTGAHTFFSRAKNVYVQQNKTKRLLLWPFFRCIWQMMYSDLGIVGSFRQWYKVGRFVGRNSWQVFLMASVYLGLKSQTKPTDVEQFHERLVVGVGGSPLGGVLLGFVVFIVFMLLLGPIFYLVDKNHT